MKKWITFLSITLFASSLLLTGCATSKHSNNRLEAGYFEYEGIPEVKDYETLGMVFVETKIDRDNLDEGDSSLTYYKLLKEASEKYNADAIINVTIEETRSINKTGRRSDQADKTIRRYGAALAIKYTKTLSPYRSLEATEADQRAEKRWAAAQEERDRAYRNQVGAIIGQTLLGAGGIAADTAAKVKTDGKSVPDVIVK